MDATFFKSERRENRPIAALAPLVVLPVAALILFPKIAAWQFTWILATSIYAGLKWLTFATSRLAPDVSTGRVFGYLLLWPGMDAPSFLDPNLHGVRPTASEVLFAISKVALGVILLFAVAGRLIGSHPLLAGWAGMIGLIFVLHFGVFHVLSICWRFCGVDARPIMNFPIRATSLSDFWGRRWNLAFRDLAFGYVFKKLVRPLGAAGATMVVFLVSGVIHDLVISVPAEGGWGGPTIYFVTQGVGLLVERSRIGKQLGLGEGIVGRVYCGLCTVGPVRLLFHEPFVRQVILPTLAAIGAI